MLSIRVSKHDQRDGGRIRVLTNSNIEITAVAATYQCMHPTPAISLARKHESKQTLFQITIDCMSGHKNVGIVKSVSPRAADSSQVPGLIHARTIEVRRGAKIPDCHAKVCLFAYYHHGVIMASLTIVHCCCPTLFLRTKRQFLVKGV